MYKVQIQFTRRKNCHIVEGEINTDVGISKFFSPKGDGMLPGDIVWEFIKKTGKKLEYEEGHVIRKGAQGFQCKDCKYYLYSNRCLLIIGNTFMPEMSCAFIVKIDNGTRFTHLYSSAHINRNASLSYCGQNTKVNIKAPNTISDRRYCNRYYYDLLLWFSIYNYSK